MLKPLEKLELEEGEEVEIEVKALDNLDLKIKMDGVIVAVAHDEYKKNPFLAQVLSLERKCIYGYDPIFFTKN
jgi:predicted DNA-binding antitoxin AbrB/MazE fold protein